VLKFYIDENHVANLNPFVVETQKDELFDH